MRLPAWWQRAESGDRQVRRHGVAVCGPGMGPGAATRHRRYRSGPRLLYPLRRTGQPREAVLTAEPLGGAERLAKLRPGGAPLRVSRPRRGSDRRTRRGF